jgi:hypothetical protein
MHNFFHRQKSRDRGNLLYRGFSIRGRTTTEIDTIEEQQTEKIETEVRDDDRIRKHIGVRNIIEGVLLGHPIHTILYTIPPLPTGPLQKRKLPDGQFCTG